MLPPLPPVSLPPGLFLLLLHPAIASVPAASTAVILFHSICRPVPFLLANASKRLQHHGTAHSQSETLLQERYLNMSLVPSRGKPDVLGQQNAPAETGAGVLLWFVPFDRI